YRKSDTPAFIAARFAELVADAKGAKWKPRQPRAPKFVRDASATMLAVKNGRVWIDTLQWQQIRPVIEANSGRLILDREGAHSADARVRDERRRRRNTGQGWTERTRCSGV